MALLSSAFQAHYEQWTGLVEPSKIIISTQALYIGDLIQMRNAECHDRWAMQWHRLHFRDGVGKVQSTPAGAIQIADSCASSASPIVKTGDRTKEASQQMEKQGEKKLQVCASESNIWLLAADALL